MLGDVRHSFDEFLFIFELRVEHAQGIGLDAPLAVRPEPVLHFPQLGAKPLHIFRPALLVANAVDVQLNAFQAQALEKLHHHFDQFGVDGGRVGTAQHFCVNLIELAIAPLLRPLAPKHRPDGVQFHRLWQLLHSVLKVGPRHRCGRLRPQAYGGFIAVLKAVHLF